VKQTIVPAQVTTVEDKIVGSVSFKQLLLFVTPVFMGVLTYAFIPPFMSFGLIKIFLWSLLSIVCFTLAIRVKQQLIIDWLVIIGRFRRRPRV